MDLKIISSLLVFVLGSSGLAYAQSDAKKETLARFLRGISLEVSLAFFKGKNVSAIYPNYLDALARVRAGLAGNGFTPAEVDCLMAELKETKNSGFAVDAQLEREILTPARKMVDYGNYIGGLIEDGEKTSDVGFAFLGDTEKTDFFARVETMANAMAEMKVQNAATVERLAEACKF